MLLIRSFYQNNLKLQFNDDQYFWLLSSLIQGFVSLLALMIVIIIFRFQFIFNQKNELSRTIKDGLSDMVSRVGSFQWSEFAFLNEEELSKYTKKILRDKSVPNDSFKKQLKDNSKKLEFYIKGESKVKKLYFLPFITSVSTILFAIVGLFIPKEIGIIYLWWWFLVLTFLMAIWSLYEIIYFVTELIIEEI